MRCKEPEISNSMSPVTGSLWNLLQLHCRAWHDAAVVRIACRVSPAGLYW